MAPLPLEIQSILTDLKTDLRNISAPTLFVGFSGGVDSAVLLNIAVKAVGAGKVTAIHVNHGLNEQAVKWQLSCEAAAISLGVQFRTYNGVVENTGQGIEASARALRYSVFDNCLPADASLLLGHHLDDQVETFFLRLMRGAGPSGLKSISRVVSRKQYKIVRPLLDLPRAQIEQIAEALGLSWINDPSNQDSTFDRNYLRQEVLPLIQKRWPSYRDRIRSTIELLNEHPNSTSESTEQQLSQRLSHDGGLKLVQLDQLTDQQTESLLHAWLTSLGQLVPSRDRLRVIIRDVIRARADSTPQVTLGDGTIRRHGLALYWVGALVNVDQPPAVVLDSSLHWGGVGLITLQIQSHGTNRIRLPLQNLTLRLRQGGEIMRPAGRSKSRDLKRLMQEYRIKPWLRDRTPLLFSSEELIAVGDELISDDHLASEGEPGLKIIWQIT